MKNVLIIVVLCFFAFSTKAQTLNFEETVKYIQDKYAEFNQDEPNSYGHSFKAIKNGTLDIKTNGSPSHFNLFNLGNNTKIGVDRFGLMKDTTQNYALSIVFYSDDKYITSMRFKPSLTVAGLEKIYKALLHLRTLCTKEKDPFDN